MKDQKHLRGRQEGKSKVIYKTLVRKDENYPGFSIAYQPVEDVGLYICSVPR